MRRTYALIGLLATTLASGCSIFTNAARNLCNEPALACEEWRFNRQARSLARESWANCPDHASASRDFRDGYLDGYADYLQAGRITDPRPAPPKRYLKVTYHTPESLQAVEDYFTGFHTGATAAEASGQRQRMIVPVIFPVRDDQTSRPSVPAAPLAEPLPLPREAPKRPPGVPEDRGPEPAAARLMTPR